MTKLYGILRNNELVYTSQDLKEIKARANELVQKGYGTTIIRLMQMLDGQVVIDYTKGD